MILTKEVKSIYVEDGYGGISNLELDWEQDCVFKRGDLDDEYGTIEEHFINKEYNWYPSLQSLLKREDEYTDIE